MKLIEIYQSFARTGLTDSARHFSTVWLERSHNYLTQNKDADISAADALTLHRALKDEEQYELAAKLLADLLEAR